MFLRTLWNFAVEKILYTGSPPFMQYWLQSVILAISFHYQLAPLIIAIRAKAKSLQYVSKIFLDLPTTYINRGLDVSILHTVMYVSKLRMYRNHADFLSNM